jgi:hypothetical protein
MISKRTKKVYELKPLGMDSFTSHYLLIYIYCRLCRLCIINVWKKKEKKRKENDTYRYTGGGEHSSVFLFGQSGNQEGDHNHWLLGAKYWTLQIFTQISLCSLLRVKFSSAGHWKLCCHKSAFTTYVTFKCKEAYCLRCHCKRSAGEDISNWRVFYYRFLGPSKFCRFCDRSVPSICAPDVPLSNNNPKIRNFLLKYSQTGPPDVSALKRNCAHKCCREISNKIWVLCGKEKFSCPYTKQAAQVGRKAADLATGVLKTGW